MYQPMTEAVQTILEEFQKNGGDVGSFPDGVVLQLDASIFTVENLPAFLRRLARTCDEMYNDNCEMWDEIKRLKYDRTEAVAKRVTRISQPSVN